MRPICIDSFLSPEDHDRVWTYLNEGAWEFGAFSEENGDRYSYKHFAGVRLKAAEAADMASVEAELDPHAPVADVWRRLSEGPLRGHRLARCYANAMQPGVEGGVHRDSNIASHLTAIYYPHPTWAASFGGETLLFNAHATDILAAVYPRPNRLVIFPGTMPHVARPLSRRATIPARITLMFKTFGASG